MKAATLFDDLPARARPRKRPEATRLARRGQQTSLEAAEELVKVGDHARQMLAVQAALAARPGLTSLQLAAASGIDRYIVARRLPDLARMGRARKGETVRDPETGRSAVTWWPVEFKGMR